MVSSDKTADQNVSSHNLQLIVTPRSNITAAEEIHDTQIHSSEPDGAESIPSMLTIINNVKNSGATTACASQSDTLSHDSRPLQSGQDIPSIIREKVSKDGYNWRKYGQKHVKGNRFIRSYYKCTYPNCQAKKQLEQQSNTGQITDTICIGHHNHRRTQLNTAQPLDHVLPAVENKVSVEHGLEPQHIKPLLSLPISALSPTDELKAAHLQLTWAKDEVHNNESPEPKRRKKSNSNSDLTADPRSTSASRVIVQTSSEVDFVNDGYRWRKYGQKQVKGNTNPRSYYRCSNPGCLVKKHVERASHDSKIVITTYEGQHDHEIPPGRAVSFNAATKTQTMTINVKPGTQSGRDAVCVETGERSCLDSESRLSEQLNGDSVSKLKGGDMVESGMIILHSEGNESKLLKQEQQNDNSGTKENSAGSDIICHSSSEVPCRSNEQLKDEVKTKSERSKDCIRVVGGNDTLGQESEFSKQSTCDAESSQS